MSRIVKAQLVKYSYLTHERRLTALFGGNLSIRQGNLIFIKATGAVMDDMTREQMAIIDMKGKQLPAIRLSSVHLAIYRERPDVKAIAYLHPPYSIIASTMLEMELYLRRIPIVPFRSAGTEELAEAVPGLYVSQTPF